MVPTATGSELAPAGITEGKLGDPEKVSAAKGRSPDYPIAYDLGKSLHAAGKAKGEFGFGAQWAGQGAPLSRPLRAGELVKLLAAELASA